MIFTTNETDITNILNKNNKLILIFVKGNNCGVCHAIEDRVNKTFPAEYPNLDIYYLSIEDNPMFRGQHLIFTVPTLLLFYKNKEVHRESRIINFNKLDNIIQALK